MLTLLAMFGRAAAPFLLRLVPGVSPRLSLFGAAIAALLVSHGGVALYVWASGYKARVEAVAAVETKFTVALAREKEINDAKVQAAVEAAAREQPVSADRARRVQQCRESPTCRDRRRQ